jgi:hypothetical protein
LDRSVFGFSLVRPCAFKSNERRKQTVEKRFDSILASGASYCITSRQVLAG